MGDTWRWNIFLQRQHDLDLEPITHNYPSLYVRATYALVSCTAHLSNLTRQRTCYQHHESQYECFKPLHALLGLYPAYRDTNSLTPPVAYNGSLSTVNETCNNDKRHCTKKRIIVGAHLSSLHLLSRTWELLKSSSWSLSMQVIKFASTWAAEVIRPLHWNLKFDFECLRAVRCTWLSDIQKLSTILVSISPASCLQNFSKIFRKKSNGSHRTCHELSTFVRWLSYVHIAWLVGLRDGSLRACSSALSHSINAGIGVEPVLSCGNDVGGDVPDELDEQKVVDKPGPR